MLHLLKQEASAACEAYLAKYNSGGGNWASGQQIGRVSSSGRVWDAHECCVYNPFDA